MCNPKPSSPSSLLSQKKTPTTNLNESGDPQPDDHQELHRWPTPAEVLATYEVLDDHRAEDPRIR
uniref:Uncharacterized protein n=1 Tax=Fagus sylvatica TaxID=28930 RepID=A0A2N9H1T7_FAGSY